MIRLPQVKDAERGFNLEQGAKGAIDDAFRRLVCRNSRSSSTEVVGPVIGADLQKKGIYATLASIVGMTDLHRAALPLHVRAGRDRRDVPRHLHRLCDAELLRLRAVAECRRRDSDDHRLLGERHHRHLRSRARELAAAAARAARPCRQSECQPDPGTDGHHLGCDVPAPCWRCTCLAARCFTALRSRCWSASSAAPTRRCSSPPPSPSSSAAAKRRPAAPPCPWKKPSTGRAKAAAATSACLVARHRAVLLLEAALLGVVQGLTEFLPVSSSAHLILARVFFGWDAEQFGRPFDVACHLGTLGAILVYFRQDLASLVARAAGSAPPDDP